jgi:hypothetical protein
MPEEVGIVLLILIFAGWVLIKLLQAFASGLSSTQREFSRSIRARAEQRLSKKKSRLAQHIHSVLPNQLEQAENQLHTVRVEFSQHKKQAVWNPQRPAWTRKNFTPYLLVPESNTQEQMDIEDIHDILRPNSTTWVEKESELLSQDCIYQLEAPKVTSAQFKPFPEITLSLENALFEVDNGIVSEKQISRFFKTERNAVFEYNERRLAILSRRDELNGEIQSWNVEDHKRWSRYTDESRMLADHEISEFKVHSEQYNHQCVEQKNRLETMAKGFRAGLKQGVESRVEHILGSLTLPSSLPRSWEIDFNEDQHILIVELALPDVVHRPPFKTVRLKTGCVQKPLNQTERKELVPKIHPGIVLRFAYEIFRNDDSGVISLLVLNGWVDFDDPKTGVNIRAYTASLMVECAQIESLNLRKIDPLAAFQSLSGKSAGKLIEIIPIEPSLN